MFGTGAAACSKANKAQTESRKHPRTSCPCQVLDGRQYSQKDSVHMHRKESAHCCSYVHHQDIELAGGLAVADQTNEGAIYITFSSLNIHGVKDKCCCEMFGT